jgi:hypothetical protein
VLAGLGDDLAQRLGHGAGGDGDTDVLALVVAFQLVWRVTRPRMKRIRFHGVFALKRAFVMPQGTLS